MLFQEQGRHQPKLCNLFSTQRTKTTMSQSVSFRLPVVMRMLLRWKRVAEIPKLRKKIFAQCSLDNFCILLQKCNGMVLITPSTDNLSILSASTSLFSFLFFLFFASLNGIGWVQQAVSSEERTENVLHVGSPDATWCQKDVFCT